MTTKIALEALENPVTSNFSGEIANNLIPVSVVVYLAQESVRLATYIAG